MLHLADMMQYEDDFDDQNFYENRNRKRFAEDEASDENSKKDKSKKETPQIL